MTDDWDAEEPLAEDGNGPPRGQARPPRAAARGPAAALRAAGTRASAPRRSRAGRACRKRTVYRDLRALDSEIRFPVWSEGGRWGVEGGAFLPRSG